MRYRTTVTSKEDGQAGSFEYVWVDGKLISIVFVSDGSTSTAKYLYNDFDEPVGMIVTDDDGTLSTYYYLKNAQGDITNIISASGRKLIEFTHDAFGNQTVHYQYDPSTIIGMLDLVEQVMVHSLTPFGYRGYCYDVYSGLYYLQSRYYDPQTGRFINADDTNYLNATGTVLGCNLFAYCENDAVNCVDPSGTTLIICDNKNRVLSLLKKISNDSLSVDENGEVSYEINDEPEYVYGTGLVRALIACSKIITICETNSSKEGSYVYAENYYNSLLLTKNGKVTRYGKGSNSVVFLNLYDPSKSFKNPLYIILAHELIHAYRNARGMNIDYNIWSASFQCKMIECFVVGLYKERLPALMKHYVKYTENRIRKEHGLVLRTKYNGW